MLRKWSPMLPTRVIYALVMLSCSACAAVQIFKADEAPNSGFLPKSELLTKMPERSPFNKSWVTADRQRYDKIKMEYSTLFVPPVDITPVKKKIDSSDADSRTKQIQLEEAQELASYFRARVKLDLKGQPTQHFVYSETPGEKALALHLALVEVQPSNPVVNVVGTAAGAFVPGGGLIKIFGKGSIAFEGLVKDSASGELFEQFKDRENDKEAPFTVRDFQKFAHLRVAIDEWSEQIVEIVVNPVEHKVAPSLPFTVNPL